MTFKEATLLKMYGVTGAAIKKIFAIQWLALELDLGRVCDSLSR